MKASQGTAAAIAVLQQLQNRDGGWGYHEGSESRVEPTCWAMSALSCAADIDLSACTRALEFLLKNQSQEGFWTASPEMQTGNWVTSLACLVLKDSPQARDAITRGLTWLCGDYPLDTSFLLRLVRRLRSNSDVADQSDAFRGWGWTPRTSSWVEPTAFALMALQAGNGQAMPGAARRIPLAVGLLHDRMCPGGGWNSGNPKVYGVAGEPLVLPTAWALLALRDFPDHETKSQSLAWLRAEAPKIESAGSRAVAGMCLEAYGEPVPPGKLDLRELTPESVVQDGVHVLAWVCLALNPDRRWPLPARGKA